jgi:hypothetical protein
MITILGGEIWEGKQDKHDKGSNSKEQDEQDKEYELHKPRQTRWRSGDLHTRRPRLMNCNGLANQEE